MRKQRPYENEGDATAISQNRPARILPHRRMKPIDFLGIGAQKAGTTWLWEILRAHPQIWLPPRKELHYFDRALDYESPSFLASTHLLTRLFSRAPHDVEFREKCDGALRFAAQMRDWAAFRWSLRYYFGTYSDAWYLSLFAQGGEKLRGEITPAYAILREPDVARIARIMPRLKILFLLRNPVERAWSQVRFDWTRGASSGVGDPERIRAFIDSPVQALRSDYLRTLDIWEAHFPREQMFTGFYDDIAERPTELQADVLRFLGADPALGRAREELVRKVHVSKEAEMPPDIRRYLAAKYLPDLAKLSARIGGRATQWLREVEAMQ